MKKFNDFILMALLVQSFNIGAIEPSMQSVISQWFSIDNNFDIQMKKTFSEESDGHTKFHLNFISDDQNKVNGTLAIPKNYRSPLKLALLLHAMGSDQNLWWNENKISGMKISHKLLAEGYAVVTLDARGHGQRKIDKLGPKDMIEKARSDQPRLYNDMIIGTVRDYRIVLDWLKRDLELDNTSILVSGYSMGAQMGLLLASYESEINQVMAMVPPYVSHVESPVAPRLHVSRIKHAKLTLLAAKNDPFSTQDNYIEVFEKIGTAKKSIKWFNSGHLLPVNYYLSAFNFIEKQTTANQVQ